MRTAPDCAVDAPAATGGDDVETARGLRHHQRLTSHDSLRIGDKIAVKGKPLTVISPLPGRRKTRATLDLRRPVP